ncbi:hypothetical protein [Chryseolinea lacunae]|uniref:DUF4238 domain-containing protein n=1 Tax=Chryseolinea lacunae TaxID=2801331 RepID=A0ABS1KZY7_9BACT|nr:hypothetical protein [Chryseolinea lacunae]MBL0745019.1 hypothetical protein [Chryseolinea lacunae]
MSKTYKVSYKIFLNDRLKKVHFHGKLTHPLYVHVTYDRKTIFFKSYYFELFSKPRYVVFSSGKKQGPTIDQIIEKEKELIDFVIEKTLSDFSLERFKEEYLFYGQDLCDLTEPGFGDYLFTFFQDKGMPALATAIREGGKLRIFFDVVRDMKMALNKQLYDELIENSFYYAPPYLPLFGFMVQSKIWPMLSMSIMEWEDAKLRTSFSEYVSKKFPHQSVKEVEENTEKWIAYLRKKMNLTPP